MLADGLDGLLERVVFGLGRSQQVLDTDSQVGVVTTFGREVRLPRAAIPLKRPGKETVDVSETTVTCGISRHLPASPFAGSPWPAALRVRPSAPTAPALPPSR